MWLSGGLTPPLLALAPPQQHPPRTSSAPHHTHDDANSGLVSRAGSLQSPDTDALRSMMVTMLAKMDARDERVAELDRKRQEQQQELDRKRQEQQHERENERYRLLIEIQRENSAGLKQLRRDMANNPRFSRRGTPTSTPVPAVDDRPKPAPRKTPTKADPTAPYQAADRHPGSAEPTPTTYQCTQNPRVPALPLLIPQPPTQPPGVASMITSVRSFVSVRTSVTGSAGSVILSVTGSVGSVTAYSAPGSNGYVGL